VLGVSVAVMDPRTFLPSRALASAAAPEPGDRAPMPPAGLEEGSPAVVAFLRHTGRPFAEATMLMLRDAAATSPTVAWIAISHAPAAATERWCDAIGGTGNVRVASDPSRQLYATWD
jgi:hypothetical protein